MNERSRYLPVSGSKVIFFLWLLLFTSQPAFTEETLLPAAGEFSLIDAVRYTIAKETNIKMEESQVEIARGTYQSATGAFDITLGTQLKAEEDENPSAEPDYYSTGLSRMQTQTYALSQSVSKTFRYGTSINSSIGIERNDYQYLENAPVSDNGTITFTVKQPLLKGRGIEANAAGEFSKRELYDAAQYNLRRTVSQKIYETVTAYWAYRGAHDKVTTLETSIKNIKKSIEQLKELIKGGEKPASDLNQYLANLATRKIDLLSAKQASYSAGQTLAVAMGIPYTQSAVLPPATDDFPDVVVSSLQPVPQWLKDQTLASRSDLKAAEKDLAAAGYQLDAARNNMRSQLDMSLQFKYSDVTAGTYDENGTSISALLNYEFPVDNNTAAGQMVEARAGQNRIRYQIEGLKRSIASDLDNAIDALAAYVSIKEQYESTLTLNRQLVKDERTKYTLGTSDLFNVIQVEDNLTLSLINLIQSKINVANALIKLRYTTESILDSQQTTFTLNGDRLTRIPGKQVILRIHPLQTMARRPLP